MADNITNFYSPSSIRLSSEPVHVKLESSDHSLLLANLQSAFPHCTGIYFRPNRGGGMASSAECGRMMLKFDGRRFLPPDGGWNVCREYFVEFGGGKQSFPFGSYEQATRQFERSVNLVQQMMNGSMLLKGKKGEMEGRRQRMAMAPLDETTTVRDEMGNDVKNDQNGAISVAKKIINGQQKSLPTVNNFLTKPEKPLLTSRSQKQLERDFADLASICAGKDMVIDGQRAAMDKLRVDLDNLRAEQTQWTQKEMEWNAKLEAGQQELELLRELGKDQQEWHSQIVELNSQLERGKNEWAQCKAGMEENMQRLEAEAREWKEKSELAAWTSNDLSEQLRKTQREKVELQRKTAILEEQVNGEAMEFSRRFQERERVQRELLQDNTRLYQLKDHLELECQKLREQLERCDAEFDRKISEMRKEHEERETALLNGLDACETKCAKLESMVAELTRAKDQALEQLERHKNHSEVGNSEPPLFAYSQP